MIDYLANPDNEWLDREHLATEICHITRQTLYAHFTPYELTDIESSALKLRRKQYSVKLSKVDQTVLNQAIDGDSQMAKLAYQRFEGWSEKQKHEIAGKDGEMLVINYRPKPD